MTNRRPTCELNDGTEAKVVRFVSYGQRPIESVMEDPGQARRTLPTFPCHPGWDRFERSAAVASCPCDEVIGLSLDM